jgi:CHAD domain-containing protein
MTKRSARTPGGAKDLSPPTGLVEAARRRLRDRTTLLRHCRKKFSEKAVHRLRVETRRLVAQLDGLAALLPVAARQAGRRALRKQMKALAALRDVHVQLRRVRARRVDQPELKPFQTYLRDCELAARRTLARKLGRKKHERRIAALEDELRRLAARPPKSDRRFAEKTRRMLEQARHELIQRWDQGVREKEPLHRLRVALKTYRYLVEALQSLLPASTAAQLDGMRAWQACLGEIHDLALFEQQLGRFAGLNKAGQSYERILGTLARRRRQLARRHDRFAPAGLRAGTLPGLGPPAKRKIG